MLQSMYWLLLLIYSDNRLALNNLLSEWFHVTYEIDREIVHANTWH